MKLKFYFSVAGFKRNRSAFTLMEMMTVVVVMGVLALAAIPSYQKTVEQRREETARLNLDTIYNAQKIYWASMQQYAEGDLTAINSQLGLSIIPSTEFAYQCNGVAGWLACDAIRQSGVAYRINVGSDSGCYPPCCEVSFVCPSLPSCPSGGVNCAP